MWDGPKKADSCLWAVLRPFVWLHVILIAIAIMAIVSSVASGWLHRILGPTLAPTVIGCIWLALIGLALFAVIRPLFGQRRAK